MNNDNLQYKTYILEGLGCANCAAKMEQKISQLPQVEDAVLTFATKQLKIAANDPASMRDEIQSICQSIEAGVTVVEKADVCVSDHEHSTGLATLLGKHKRDIIILAVGTVFFAGGLLLEHLAAMSGSILFLLFAAAYLLLGHEVLITAGRNISHGQVFDENFLMSLATLAAFCISDFAEGVGVMLFYRIGELFEHIAVERSRSQIMDAVDMRPETVLLVVEGGYEQGGHEHHHDHHDHDCECGCGHDHHEHHHDHHKHHHESDGSFRIIPAQAARPGDVLLVRPGDRIPLDGIVIDGHSRVDTSPVTGEPVPVAAVPGVSVISGCINQQGTLKIRVTHPLSESMVTKILDSVENAAAGKPKIDKFITRFARIYTPIVVVLAVMTAIVPSLITGDWAAWIKTAITFLVISCPCALVISVPLAFFSGIGAASKLGILFKGGLAMEALKNVKCIVMDKTGTITKGTFAVENVSPFGDMAEDALLTLAASCEAASSHPVAVSITEAAGERALSITAALSSEELAGMGIVATFDESFYPGISVPAKAVANGESALGTVNDSHTACTVLCGNRRLMDRYGVTLPELSPSTEPTDMPGSAGTEILIAVDNVPVGRITISDQLKEDSVSAVNELKSMALTPAMLTGDNMESAAVVASATGISHVRGGLLPADKVDALKKLRSQLGPVMFVGDGINDAPVLAGADVGAAMGSGADAAIEAADVVFMTSSLTAVPQSISIAKRVGRIAAQNIVFALGIKLLVILLGLAGFANIWAAVFADTGVAMLCILNSLRILTGSYAYVTVAPREKS